MNSIQQNDIKTFAERFELSDELKGAHFLITGGTGLIGSTLVHCLHALEKGITITCPVRNIRKAKKLYGEGLRGVEFIECDLLNYLNHLSNSIDYIVHCASPTSGKYMAENPVETFELAIETTGALLRFAKRSGIKSMVYVSSLEYYGQNFDDRVITEDMLGMVNHYDARSSYPLGKSAAEYLCFCYAKEYNVNVKTARLTQTFGAGVSAEDNRVFAQFARSVIDGTNIVMHTKGESAKPYCYTTDCASAIFRILLKGEKGEAYNVANTDTYISIADMAHFLCDNFNPSVQVVVSEQMGGGNYAPTTKLRLSSDKLMALGWKPYYGLREMFNNLIESIKEDRNTDK